MMSLMSLLRDDVIVIDDAIVNWWCHCKIGGVIVSIIC